MASPSNRGLTLAGTNKIFEVIGIKFSQSPLGFYESTGEVELQARTLTELCQQVLLKIAGGSDAGN